MITTSLISDRSWCGTLYKQGQARQVEGRVGTKSERAWCEDFERETKGLLGVEKVSREDSQMRENIHRQNASRSCATEAIKAAPGTSNSITTVGE